MKTYIRFVENLYTFLVNPIYDFLEMNIRSLKIKYWFLKNGSQKKDKIICILCLFIQIISLYLRHTI